MPIVNGYATLPEFRQWIAEDDDLGTSLDPLFETQVNASSRWVDQQCGRHFYQVVGVRTFDARSACDLRVDDVVTVTELATDDNDDGTYETIWDPADYQVVPPSGSLPGQPSRQIRAVGARIFPCGGRRVHRVRVTATWGWPAIPDAIHTACLIEAARLVKRRKSPEGVTGFGNEFGHIRVTNRDDPDALSLLAPYVLPLVA